MARGVPKDPQKRQAQIEHGKRLAEYRKAQIKKNGSQRTTPTFKEKEFSKAYVKHKGNGSKAALEVYDTTKENAPQIANQILKKPIVQQEIKKQLDEAGLSIDTLNDLSLEAVENNLKYGKYSQSAGISHLQFLYKLHNVLPVAKKMNMNLSLHDQLPSKDMDDLKKTLEDLQKTNNALIAAIEGKK